MRARWRSPKLPFGNREVTGVRMALVGSRSSHSRIKPPRSPGPPSGVLRGQAVCSRSRGDSTSRAAELGHDGRRRPDLTIRVDRPPRGPSARWGVHCQSLDTISARSRHRGHGAAGMVLSRPYFAQERRAALLARFKDPRSGKPASSRPRSLGEGRISRAMVDP